MLKCLEILDTNSTYDTYYSIFTLIVQTLEENDSNIEEDKAKIQESNEAEEKDLKESVVESEEVPAPSTDPGEINS